MTVRLVETNCPECGKPDATNIEIDEERNDFFVVTECLECQHPYAIRIVLSLRVSGYKLEKVTE